MFKKIPHTYVIIFYIIIIASLMTLFIPGGEYVKKTILENGIAKNTVEFHRIENDFQTWQIFSALFDGFVRQSDIIVFILMIGGAFWIMNSSKAIDVGIFSFLKFTKKLSKIKIFKFLGVDNLIITLIMLMFSVFGAVFGMSEETIAFVVIMVPLSISMGYDSIIGVSMVFVGAGLGFAGAVLNPFTIGIAQSLAGIVMFSGIEYRFICWIIINVVGIAFVLIYASKIRKKPKLSIVYQEDEYWRNKNLESENLIEYQTPIGAYFSYFICLIAMIVFSITSVLPENIFRETTLTIGNNSFTTQYLIIGLAIVFAILGFLSLKKSVHFFILLLLSYTMIFLIVGVMGYSWYVKEIASIFFAMGIASGIAMNYNPDKIAKLFMEGVADILSAAIVVGLAAGIIIILENGKVIDSILYGMSKSMNNLGEIASVSIMYFIQTMINIVIPSGSAKAAITMPVMAPFADLIGISRQSTVMAFQFGDGFTNMITPTSGVLIAVLGIAKIPYEKWVKWITPLMIILIILGLLLLIPTVKMNLTGFDV